MTRLIVKSPKPRNPLKPGGPFTMKIQGDNAIELKNILVGEVWIASGQSNATRWAAEIGRNDESVLAWVHQYNQAGPAALTYRPTGGRAPFFPQTKSRN